MLSNKVIVNRLSALVLNWGGQIIRCAELPSNCLQAPDVDYIIGVNYKKKIIAFDAEKIWWPDLLHEMGHLYASPYAPNDSDCIDYDFFGWKYAVVAKYLNSNIDEWVNYVFGEVPVDHRKQMIDERIKFALDKCLIVEHDNQLLPLLKW